MARLLHGYDRVNWVNEPPKVTPLNEENLNNMDAGIADLYDLLTDYDSDNLEKNTIVEIQINGVTIEPDENRVVNLDMEHIDPVIVDPYKIIDVDFTGITSLPVTYIVEGITADHQVKWYRIDNRSALSGTMWCDTTNNGLVTFRDATIASGQSIDIYCEFRKSAHHPTPVIS